MKRCCLATCVLLLSLAPTGAQDATREGGAEDDRPVRARVHRSSGKAQVQPSGRGPWRDLGEGAALGAGDRVQAKGPLELILRGEDPKGDELQAGSTAGDRLVLGPGAKVTVAPGESADLRLEEGDCFASAMKELRVEAGKSLVTVKAGDTELSLGKDKLKVIPHSGSADVRAGEELRSVTRGSLFEVDARGKVKLRKAKVKRLPRYVLARRAPAKVLWAETFAPWPVRYPTLDAEPRPQGIARGVIRVDEEADLQFFCRQVYLGDWDNPLFTHEAGACLRIRYRLSKAVPVVVVAFQVGGRQVRHQLHRTRVGAWTDVELDLDALRSTINAEEDNVLPQVGRGSVVTYLGFNVGDHLDGPHGYDDVELLIDELVVYVPRR